MTNVGLSLCLAGLHEASVGQGGEQQQHQHLLQSQQQQQVGPRGGALQSTAMGFQGPAVAQHGVQTANPTLQPPPQQQQSTQHTHLSPHHHPHPHPQHLQSTPPPPSQASHPWAPPSSHPLSSPPLTPQKVPHIQVSLRAGCDLFESSIRSLVSAAFCVSAI